jgi:hypothetical protein
VATSASANAGSLMWFFNRISFFVPVERNSDPNVSNSALSAAGSQNGPPGLSSPESPPSGIRKRTGPFIAFSFRARKRPIFWHSSTVVRISVTLLLCRWSFRSRYCGGTVSMAQKFTMSSAPSDPT